MLFPPWPPGSPGCFLPALKAREEAPPRPGYPKTPSSSKSPGCYSKGQEGVVGEAGMRSSTEVPPPAGRADAPQATLLPTAIGIL